jgi:hypothetical protein
MNMKVEGEMSMANEDSMKLISGKAKDYLSQGFN